MRTLQIELKPNSFAERRKIVMLRQALRQNLHGDVRDYAVAIRGLFGQRYIVGCGSSHVWVHRHRDPYNRFLLIT